MKITNRKQILKNRKEIEKELIELLKQTKGDFSLEDIKSIIYNEEDQDDLVKVIAIFDRGQGLIEMNEIIEVINDAWNFFPHKCLSGLCPMEKISEQHQNKNRG